jgi:hypothetical protein
MPRYSYTIRQDGLAKPSTPSECPDNDAAQREAIGMFADMARDIADNLRSSPDWQIEVADEAGKPIFRISIHAE